MPEPVNATRWGVRAVDGFVRVYINGLLFDFDPPGAADLAETIRVILGAQPMVEQLLAERDALKAELAEARASGSHLAEVAADEYLALKAERDAAQAAIGRVRAILDQPLLRTSDPERAGERFLARQIAAALDTRGACRD